MAKFIVEGGHHLKGEITPQGAKNEALQIICATLLTSERAVLHNVPIISDVMQLLELLQRMGVKVERLSDDSFAIQADNVDLEYLRSADYHKRCRRLRGSVMMIGPLLTRFGIGFMPKPGGDKIGRRRLDTHFLGFQKLGATFNFDQAEEFFSVEAKQLVNILLCCAQKATTFIRHEHIEAQTVKAFHIFARTVKVLYRTGAAIQLRRLGYKLHKVDLTRKGMLS